MPTYTIIILLLAATLRVATPLVLASLAGLFSERSGMIDLGLEGKMLGAAFAAAAVSAVTGSVWAGLGAAVLFGALYQGGSQLSFDLPRINRDMVVVIQGLVILACGALENLFRTPLAALFARWRHPGEGT